MNSPTTLYRREPTLPHYKSPTNAVHATPEAFERVWLAACTRTIGAESLQLITRDLFSRYTEPRRRYHTLDHLEYCFVQMTAATALLEDRIATELAIWFHDVVHDPHRTDNEERSAAHFAELALGCIGPSMRARVMQLIETTAYPYQPMAADECFLVDIDLSSFGRPWSAFLRDSENVRLECEHLTDVQYHERHLRFLRSQLERDSFCFTEFFDKRHGRQATQNIQRFTRLVNARLNDEGSAQLQSSIWVDD